MKNCLVSCFCWLFFGANGFSQVQKFDIASFIPPQGWQRVDTNGTVAFLHSKSKDGLTSFCQIILYPGTSSTGNADKDFKAAWNNLVIIPANSKTKPVTQKQKTPDGWTVVTGAATITHQGIHYNSIVTTLTGFGKTMSVQVNLAGNDYAEIIQKFFDDLELDSQAIVKNNQQNINPIQPTNSSITMNDYDFIVPEGWQLQNNKDHLLIQDLQSGCAIRILSQPSSGNLENDVNSIFDIMYAGWQYQKTGEQQYILSRGFLPKGLEYCMKEASMSTTGADGRYHLEEGAALVVKAGSQIAIISVRHNSSMLAHDRCYRNYNTWRRFFNSFTIKNLPAPKNIEDVSSKIIGAWSQTESGASSEYIFSANGNYAFNGAVGTSSSGRDYNYEYLHIRTYAFEGDGSYAVSGDQLNLKKRNSNSEQLRLRFEKVNYGGSGWKDRLYLLKKDGFGENEVCYNRKGG